MMDRRFQPLAFLGEHVDQHGDVAMLRELQILGEGLEIMPVDWPQITQSKFLEQGRLHEEVLRFAFPF